MTKQPLLPSKSACWVLIFLSIAALIILYQVPVHNKRLCLVFLTFCGIIWISTACLLFRFKKTFWLYLTLTFLPLAVIGFTPLGDFDRPALHQRYVKNLLAYNGVEYVWGGENHKGIDCSGLPRRAYRDALFSESLRQMQPALAREALFQWWYDSSAKALKEGYRNNCMARNLTGSIKDLSTENLYPGDLAITSNGVHVIVYMGNDQWLQADPGRHKVHLAQNNADNSWFQMPVALFYWSLLE